MRHLTIPVNPNHAFECDWAHRLPLDGLSLVAYGGGSGLAEPFLYAAALSGMRIVIVDRLPEEERARSAMTSQLEGLAANAGALSGRQPTVFLADVTESADVIQVTEAANEILDGIDVAVNFAGVAGAFIITAALSRLMVPRRTGHIIHLCSNGSRLSLYGAYAYNASKHGVEGIVKTAAAQLAQFGVRVNAIAPGTVENTLNRYGLLRNDDGTLKPRAKSILAHTPTKKFATAEGVAVTLLSMCTPQPHLNGNVVFADDAYNVEGHSWPEGTEAVYRDRLDETYENLNRDYPQDGK